MKHYIESEQERLDRISNTIIKELEEKGSYKIEWTCTPDWIYDVCERVTNEHDFYLYSIHNNHIEFKRK